MVMAIKPNKDKPSVLEIQLKNTDAVVLIDETDFNELMAMDVSSNWGLSQGTVVAFHKGERLAVSRLIRNCGPKTKIIYQDRNQLNLTKDNLIVARGAGKANPRDQLHRKE